MDVLLMALPGSRLTPPSAVRLLVVARCGAIVVALAFAPLSMARAQVTVGGDRGPDVTIDQSVLDSLGPPLTLPQMFEAQHGRATRAATEKAASQRAATPKHHSSAKARTMRSTRAARRVKRRTPPRVATRKRAPSSSKARSAHVATASTRRHEVIHLIPPAAISTAAREKPAPKPATPAPAPRSVATEAPSKAATAAVTEQPRATPTPPTAPSQASLPQPTAVPPLPPALPGPGSEATAQREAPQATAAPTPLLATQSSAATAPATPKTESGIDGAKSPPVQVATAASVGHAIESVKFAPGATDVPPAARPVLDRVATRLLADEGMQLQLIAHATGSSDDAMEARRISLARAVAVRAYLIDKGVRSLRINVRALGNRSDKGPAKDEVDLQLVSP
jgi:outer membrane protein OmpA-like peptidoglycan-associated protein